MSAEISPLRKRTREGKLYVRPPEIEQVIVETLEIPFEEFMKRAKLKKRDHPDYLPSEVLVYWIRAIRHEDSDRQFSLLYQLLHERILRTCSSASTHWGGKVGGTGTTMDVREFVVERFVTLLLTDRDNYTEKLDFFEVRFDRALMLLKRDALRKVSRRDSLLTPLEDEESGDIREDVEASFTLFNPPSMTLEEELTYRFQIRQAIDSLPDEERRVIDMLEAGISIESKDPNEPSISRELGCTPKTVRNRRKRALKKIREQLGPEIPYAN